MPIKRISSGGDHFQGLSERLGKEGIRSIGGFREKLIRTIEQSERGGSRWIHGAQHLGALADEIFGPLMEK
jgi:hypothetical protein